VKIIFLNWVRGRYWYRLRQRLLICVSNLALWNKNEQAMFQEVLFGNKKAEPSLTLPFLVDKRI
jgi:hypothetical protein